MVIQHGCMKMVLLILIICILNQKKLSGANAQTYEEVLDQTGALVRFGIDYSFTFTTEEGASSPLYHFGNGGSGDPVHTDTEIIMGMFQDYTQIMACVNGSVILVPHTSTPENALIKVRRNYSTSGDEATTGRFYRLDITETPDVGVQFDTSGGGRNITCTPGQLGTPFQFLNPASISTSNMHPTS